MCNDDGGRLQVGGSGRISGVRNDIGKSGYSSSSEEAM